MEVRILNHWTNREVPELHLFNFIKTLYTSNDSNTFVVEYRAILQVKGQKKKKNHLSIMSQLWKYYSMQLDKRVKWKI